MASSVEQLITQAYVIYVPSFLTAAMMPHVKQEPKHDPRLLKLAAIAHLIGVGVGLLSDQFLTSALLGLAAAILLVTRTKLLEAIKKDTESTRSRGREEVERWVDDVDRFLGEEVRAFKNSRLLTVPVLCHFCCLWLELDNRLQKLKSHSREILSSSSLIPLEETATTSIDGGKAEAIYGIRHKSNPSPPPTQSCCSESEPGRNECQAEVEKSAMASSAQPSSPSQSPGRPKSAMASFVEQLISLAFEICVPSFLTAAMMPLVEQEAKHDPSLLKLAVIAYLIGVNLLLGTDQFLASALLSLAAATLLVTWTKPKDVFLGQLRLLEAIRKDTDRTGTGSRRMEEVELWVDDVDRFLGEEARAFENSRLFNAPVICHFYCLWLYLDHRLERLKSRSREIQRSTTSIGGGKEKAIYGIRHKSNPSPPLTLSCSSESEPGRRNESQAAEEEIQEIQTKKSYGDGVTLEPFLGKPGKLNMTKRSHGAEEKAKWSGTPGDVDVGEEMQSKKRCGNEAMPRKEDVDTFLRKEVQRRTGVESPEIGATPVASEILNHLTDDSGGIAWIAGLPGVGKTALLRSIQRVLRATQHFDVVSWVMMSRWSTPMQVQWQIGKRLGLSLWEDGPDFLRDRQARTLQKLLSHTRFLLLVDEVSRDLQPEFIKFLNQVGIPLPGAGDKSKIACTTQSAPGSLPVVQILMCGLDWETGKLLLSPIARMNTPPVDVTYKYIILQEYQKILVDKTRGLPFALIILKQLVLSTCDLAAVHERLASIVRKLDMHGAEDQVVPQILDYVYHKVIGPEQQALLSYCSLFPEHHTISVKALAEYCVCEDVSDKEGDTISVMKSLKSAAMLEDSVVEDEVEMHPAVREVALRQSCGRHLVHAGTGLKELPTSVQQASEMATRISLMYNYIKELKLTDGENKLCFPKLLTLLLNNNPLTRISEGFFLGMPKLRVLDLSWTKIEELPEMKGLLGELQYLNLSHTRIRSLPELHMVKLKLLNLSHTDCLSSIPPVSGLKNLRQLNMYNTVHRWSEDVNHGERTRDNLNDLEYLDALQQVGLTVKSTPTLKRLKNLKTSLLKATMFLSLDHIHDLIADDLSTILEEMGSLQELRITEAPELEEIKLSSQSRCSLEVLSLNHLPRAKIVLRHSIGLRHLHILGCHGLVDLECVRHLPNLESFELRICHEIQRLSSGISNREQQDYFRSLQRMVLLGLPKLESLSSSPLLLPSLKYLEIDCCPKLKRLPLRETSAKDIEDILGSQEWWDGLEWPDYNIKSTLDPHFRDPRQHMKNLEDRECRTHRFC